MCRVQTEVLQTTHAGHALSLLRRYSLHGQDGVVVVGGDGTLMEALNGLLTRAPADQPPSSPLPIGVIPGQSRLLEPGIDITPCRAELHGWNVTGVASIVYEHELSCVCPFAMFTDSVTDLTMPPFRAVSVLQRVARTPYAAVSGPPTPSPPLSSSLLVSTAYYLFLYGVLIYVANFVDGQLCCWRGYYASWVHPPPHSIFTVRSLFTSPNTSGAYVPQVTWLCVIAAAA